MLLLPQRYKFSSKSQLYGVIAPESASCCCYRKGTNFQANHNKQSTHSCVDKVVVATAKVQIFKQITTTCAEDFLRNTLLLLPQRYKFSSKSQQVCNVAKGSCSCCCYRKGTNFQANHNKRSTRSCANTVVVATAKVQIFKQITTVRCNCTRKCRCCCYRKGTNFQANHNGRWTHGVSHLLLLLPQRYKFSSKSQRISLFPVPVSVVVATAKVQIFKQITTGSNIYYSFFCCCCYRKGTNFQANHNVS